MTDHESMLITGLARKLRTIVSVGGTEWPLWDELKEIASKMEEIVYMDGQDKMAELRK